MALILTLNHPRGRGERETRTLAAGTLSIGRAPGNDWVLPDPDRHLSKTHCMITVGNGRASVQDTSTNGLFLNGAREALGRDRDAPLTDGDQIRLGEYVIAVSEVDDAAAGGGNPDDPFDLGLPAAAQARPSAPMPAPQPAHRVDPFGSGGGLGGGGGIDDILGGDPLDGPFGRGAASFSAPRPAPRPAPRFDDPFDMAAREKGEAADGRDLFQGTTPAENWEGGSQADNVDAPRESFIPPKVLPPPAGLPDFDLDDLLGDTPPTAAAPASRGSAPGSPAPAAQAPPPAQSTPPPVPAPASAAAAAAIGAALVPDAARLLAAFLEGAGVPTLAMPQGDPEQALRAAGEVFRVLVEGLRDVLISRSAIKNELRVEQTMLRARDNNALKFSVTPEEAVAALLLPDRPGYMPAREAAREAFDDVRTHEMAVMAGVQTALIGLLRRFDPDALEKRLQPNLLGSLLPAARKARIWELFCTTYKDIAREAEADFQSVFGREFARAYAAQVRKG